MQKVLGFLTLVTSFGGEIIFQDQFEKELKPGWYWVREQPSKWRLHDGALQIQVEPGNMWGPENSGKNVLVRPLRPLDKGGLSLSMTVENKPTHQYEQVDLVCYFDDSHMVKIGEELVDGKLSIVMGREENDKTRTIAIIPLEQSRVELKLILLGRQVTGAFRPSGTLDWKIAGNCDLPAPGDPKVAVQCYQGPPDQEHWATIWNFKVERE